MLYRAPFVSTLLFSLSGSYAQTFNWSSVQSSTSLDWVDCYDTFKCARLEVPLDYSNEDGAKAGIAVIKYPSTSSSEDYQGSVLFNPGGPGQSGVNALQSNVGVLFASVLGPQYDIVSFDPRGVGVTLPRTEFFPTETERALWLADSNKFSHVMNATHDSTLLPKMWASAQLLGQLAKDVDTEGMLNYVGTENVARDMLRITEASGQENLMYWGISYGTALGATFASMFPDRIERMVIDGVLNLDAYYSGDWRDQIQDADAALQFFYNGCFAAGPTLCAFYADSASEIQANLESLYASVLASPIPAYVEGSSTYGVVDYPVLKNAVKTALYSPYRLSATLAQGLAELQSGNGTTIYTMQIDSAPYQCSDEESAVPYDNSWETVYAVTCGDAVENTASADGVTAYWDEIKDTSSLADALIFQYAGCSGWKVHRDGRFMGPFGGNTSFPLLIIGNTADPVTPLAAAKKAVAEFPGSVVLTQNSTGHTSLAASSDCIHGYVRAYFQNGTLPEVGIVCPVETELFPASA